MRRFQYTRPSPLWKGDRMSAGSPSARPGKYLTFAVGQELYGIGIARGNTIQGLVPITPLPQTPRFICGVINLRGQIVPIVDTRAKFGMPGAEPTGHTGIIVLEVDGKLVGILVDEVKDVMDVREDQLAPPPRFGAEGGDDMVCGLAKVNNQVRILLDVDQMLRSDVGALGGAWAGGPTAAAGQASAEELIPL